MNKLATTIVVGAFAAGALAACGGTGGGGTVTYAPAAYGQTINGITYCYYAQSYAEVALLKAAGLCPPTSVGLIMPLYWHEEYYPYYDSPSYYDHYVPVSTRRTYITVQTTFGSRYRTQIVTAESHATLRGSNGKTVSGSKVKFGSGTSFGSSAGQHPQGTMRGGSRGNTGSSSGGRGGSGGSSRSGGGMRGGGKR